MNQFANNFNSKMNINPANRIQNYVNPAFNPSEMNINQPISVNNSYPMNVNLANSGINQNYVNQ